MGGMKNRIERLRRKCQRFVPRSIFVLIAGDNRQRLESIKVSPDIEERVSNLKSLYDQLRDGNVAETQLEIDAILEKDPDLRVVYFQEFLDSQAQMSAKGMWMGVKTAERIFERGRVARTYLASKKRPTSESTVV